MIPIDHQLGERGEKEVDDLRYIKINQHIAQLVNKKGEPIYQVNTTEELYSIDDWHASIEHTTALFIYLRDTLRFNIREY